MSLVIERVGYIGLGIMGRPAALNVLRGGYAVSVWARRAEAMTPLLDAGARGCGSAAALAAECDMVITNLSDTPDVESVVGDMAGHLRGGAVVADMSTIAPAAAVRMAAALESRGVDFLDAPVSGGEKGAIEGALTFMVGGRQAAFERALPVLRTMGAAITRIGGSGAGQVAKACNQIIIGGTLSAVAEAFAMARAGGADLAKIREALLGGFAASKVLEVHAQRMISGDYAPGFKAKLHKKDIGIATATAAESGVALPSAEIFLERLERLEESGGGELDSSAIAKIVFGDS